MSTKRKRTKDVKIAREVKNAMGVLTDIPFKVMSEALYRTGLIYPIIAETPGIGLEPTAAKDTPATWSTTFH